MTYLRTERQKNTVFERPKIVHPPEPIS